MQILFDPSPLVPAADHHAPPGEKTFNGAGVGILFSLEHSNVNLSAAEELMIDTFFETFDLRKTVDHTANILTLHNFMLVMNMKDRWIYSGSLTEPPCTEGYFWNVLRTFYPIKKKHLDLLIANNEAAGLSNGNWRKT